MNKDDNDKLTDTAETSSTAETDTTVTDVSEKGTADVSETETETPETSETETSETETSETETSETETSETETPEIIASPEPQTEVPAKKKKFALKTLAAAVNKRGLKYGGMAAVFTVLVIAVVVAFNIVVNMLFDRYKVEVDLSRNGIYKLAPETETLVKAVRDDITFIVASEEKSFTAGGDAYVQVNKIINRVAADSDGKIRVEYKPLLKNPELVKEYPDLTDYNILVLDNNTKLHMILGEKDLFEVSYMVQGQEMPAEEFNYYAAQYGDAIWQLVEDQSVLSVAEQSLVSALMIVAQENPVTVGFAGGYGETPMSGCAELLKKNGYLWVDVDLTTGGDIPADVDFLILCAPTADYSAETIDKLDKWLDNDGKYGRSLVYYPVSVPRNETPRLDAFLAEWGLSIEPGYIIQTDKNNTAAVLDYFSENREATIDMYDGTQSTFFKGLNDSYNLYSYLVRPIKLLFEEKGSVRTVTHITAKDGATYIPFDSLSDDTVNPAPFKQIAVAEGDKSRFEGDTELTSRVIVFGGAAFVSSQFMEQQNANNADLFVNMFNTISGEKKVGSDVIIAPKDLAVARLSISRGAAVQIAVVLAAVLPVALVAAGIVVWTSRRRVRTRDVA